jgi:branched-chain amino acid transport system ATP-binding protein
VTTYAVELNDVHKSFGKTEIIRGAQLQVRPGERVAIIGPNGAGKSTLFNLISGRLSPTSGEVRLNGERIDGMKPYEINRRGLSRSFQVSNLFTRLSVFENVRCAVLWSMGARYSFWRFLADLTDANERAEQVLEMIKLDRKRDVLAMNLTYAEQRALEIGLTIAGGAGVVLLDEPTAQLDVRGEAEIFERILAATRHCTTILISHRFSTVRQADRICVLEHGRVVELGTHDELMARGGRYHTMFELQAQRFNAAEDEEGKAYDVLA